MRFSLKNEKVFQKEKDPKSSVRYLSQTESSLNYLESGGSLKWRKSAVINEANDSEKTVMKTKRGFFSSLWIFMHQFSWSIIKIYEDDSLRSLDDIILHWRFYGAGKWTRSTLFRFFARSEGVWRSRDDGGVWRRHVEGEGLPKLFNLVRKLARFDWA